MQHILVVDDSATHRAYARNLLLKLGYEVRLADTGDSAIAMVADNPPDLILMDLVMPGMSGFAATRKITRAPHSAHIPVVVVSAKDQATDRLWAMRQGARDYIVKPVDEAKLIEAIDRLLTENAA